MAFGPFEMVIDFAFAGLLLFVAKLIRSRVKLIQGFYIPSAVIAGFLGLVLSPQLLGFIPFSDQISSYPFLLIVFLFASLFIGDSDSQGAGIKKIFKTVGDTFAVNLAVQLFFFGAVLLVGAFLLTVFFPDLHPWFAILTPAGFLGGHGWAAAIGGAFVDSGWEEAITLGQTFATIGLLSGLIVGIICINYAIKKGATRFVSTTTHVDDDTRMGFVRAENREAMGYNTINPMSLDPLSWHILLILMAFAGGYFATNFLNSILPFSLPMMSMAMIFGVLTQVVLKLLKLNQYVDKNVITRIGSSSTDFLVTFGIASIRISVVVEFAAPIVLMSVFGLLFCLFYLFVVSRRFFRNFWFERGIFIFGYSTGVVATGVTLLRVIDPEFRSKTLEDYGTAYVLIGIIEIAIISLLPIFVMQGFGFVTGAILLLSALILLGICAKIYGLNRDKVNVPNATEQEVINS